uniref:ANK_REP_REGION domain-containing protein n=1 Tax=Macrostomum lignano TaxID=282301 RepID=A0A1I8H0B8_9PLAT
MGGHEAMVEALLLAQADPDLPDQDGQTPLYVAVKFRHLSVVKLLISAQANVNFKDDVETTALHLAVSRGYTEIVAAISVSNQVNSDQKQIHVGPLIGCYEAQADVSHVTRYSTTPLYIAAQNGRKDILTALIKAGANTDDQQKQGASALYIACQKGHAAIVDVLIKAQANPDLQAAEGETALFVASQNGHNGIVNKLISVPAALDLQRISGLTAMGIASQNGHFTTVQMLIKATADVNGGSNQANSAPLRLASEFNHIEIVQALLDARADVNLARHSSSSAVYSAAFIGHSDIVRILVKLTSALNQSEQSLQLHSKLSAAGFTEQRASLQGAAADVLERILRLRTSYEDIFIVGSYSETWGNNLVCVDGRTDSESDIDITRFVQGRPLHLKGICKCPLAETDATVEYLHRVAKSNIPNAVLQLLKRDISTFPCHVVHAAPQGQAGNQLRVSTTFLERRLMRSLSTLQGQLFVALKFLVKKIIGRRVHGLKAYHAKTITFRMVEETPAEQWTPQNLFDLLQRSLNMLLNSVQSSYGQDYDDGRIMEHFFLSDAHLYLKGADRSTAQEVANVLREVIDELPELLTKFMKTLIPVSSAGLFYFHPFLMFV